MVKSEMVGLLANVNGLVDLWANALYNATEFFKGGGMALYAVFVY